MSAVLKRLSVLHKNPVYCGWNESIRKYNPLICPTRCWRMVAEQSWNSVQVRGAFADLWRNELALIILSSFDIWKCFSPLKRVVVFTSLDFVYVAVAPVGVGDGPQPAAAFWPSSGPFTWNLSIWQSCPRIPSTPRRCSIEINAPSVLSTILQIYCRRPGVFKLRFIAFWLISRHSAFGL